MLGMNTKAVWLLGILLCWIYTLIIAHNLFSSISYAPVLYASDGKILASKVAVDGQWRFQVNSDVPQKYFETLIFYEDKAFYYHWGFNPISFLRASFQNFKHRQVLSGASTISMQLAKMGIGYKSRSIIQKIREVFLALGLEFIYTKKEILQLYAAHAPFGSNIIGLETAMWKYYNKRLTEITWAEAALFVVLPNQPNLILSQKGVEFLKQKRDLLLNRMLKSQMLDSLEYNVAVMEPIPQRIIKTDLSSMHFLNYVMRSNPGKVTFESSVNSEIQSGVKNLMLSHHQLLSQNDINNLAVLIVDNRNASIVSYQANVVNTSVKVPEAHVDMIQAPRSSGSTLKPLLVASLFEQGIVAPSSLIEDIPTLIGGFRPENFSRVYSGVVPVEEVIYNSLNVPSVLLLKNYGNSLFYNDLKKLGFRHLFRPWEDYGLSLILGGCEVTMAELVRTYSYLSYKLNHSNRINDDFKTFADFQLNWSKNITPVQLKAAIDSDIYSRSTIYLMFECMRKRVGSDELHQIAVKTGTSFGYKDAWCIGICPNYTMAVWAGNANGLSRPGLIGLHTAAPLLYDCFQLFSDLGTWQQPFEELKSVELCKESGYIPGPYCTQTQKRILGKSFSRLPTCKFHKNLCVDTVENYVQSKDCNFYCVDKSYFVLPVLEEYFYKKKNSNYKSHPPYDPNCFIVPTSISSLAFLYPNNATALAAPLSLSGDQNQFLFHAVHSDREESVFWFLDDAYVGVTVYPHQIKLIPPAGRHKLSIMNKAGSKVNVDIVVMD